MLLPVKLTIINSKCNFELLENTGESFKGILAKNNDGRQTSSEVKPGRAGLVLGWVTTFKQKLCCAGVIFFILSQIFLATTILFR